MSVSRLWTLDTCTDSRQARQCSGAAVAQRTERRVRTLQVVGPNPTSRTTRTRGRQTAPRSAFPNYRPKAELEGSYPDPYCRPPGAVGKLKFGHPALTRA